MKVSLKIIWINQGEQCVAAFAEFSRQLGKVNAQVGIRYEYDDFNYYVNRERRSDQSKVYHNLFPSATLLLPVGSTRFMLQYRSEIRRSFYSQLSSQVSYINQYTYEGGNPLLRPVLTHSVGLGVSWRWLTGQLGYQHVKMIFSIRVNPTRTMNLLSLW